MDINYFRYIQANASVNDEWCLQDGFQNGRIGWLEKWRGYAWKTAVIANVASSISISFAWFSRMKRQTEDKVVLYKAALRSR